MSGRTRVTLADGRRVTGFRKTLRVNQRTRPETRPDLRFTFMLPPNLAYATRAGEYGPAIVDVDGLVTVRGKDRDWVLCKVGEFLKSIAAGMSLDPITGILFCPSYPAPTIGGPARPGYRDTYVIVVASGSPSVTIARTGIEPVVIR